MFERPAHRFLSLLLLAVSFPASGQQALRFAFYEPAFSKGKAPEEQPETRPLVLALERSHARPQDRWIVAKLNLRPPGDLEHIRLRARLFRTGRTEPLEEVATRPVHHRGALWIDLRKPGLDEARVSVEMIEGGKTLDAAEALISARSRPNPLKPGERMTVALDVPKGLEPDAVWPVTFGVPFAAGALWSPDRLRLVDGNGKEVPCQKEVTGLWAPEGAIQWVRFDAVPDPRQTLFVEVAEAGAVPRSKVSVRREEGQIVLNTGVARYVLAAGPSPIREVWLGDRKVASAGERGLHVIDQKGRLGIASPKEESVEIEAAGPIAGCVRFEGYYTTAGGEPLARHITRVEAFAGKPFARVTHTLVLCRDTNEVWFREIGWDFRVEPGAKPQAVFNTSRDDPAKTFRHALPNAESLFMFQDNHSQFGSGKNHFALSTADSILTEGEECGDWAMLAGREAGFLVHCRETARQHPKEFELSSRGVCLKLFSSRGGEELDFRAPTLARKWKLPKEQTREVAGFDSNAIGWAKTHEICLAPLPAAEAETSAARLGAWHTFPVYASADPEWIRRSRAMGPVYPKAPDEFPHAERTIDAFSKLWRPQGHETGHYGFMNYFAGPTYWGGANYSKRFKNTYGLRPSVWLLYARSGRREERAFAEGTNKAALDNWLTHWDGPGTIKGLFFLNVPRSKDYYPFFWGDRTACQIDSTTDLNQFIWLYQLTGYRRARDAIVAFGEGLKRAWRPGQGVWRVIMVFRVLTQCTSVTWDPELRELADKTFDTFVDLESEVGLTKHNRPYKSSTYKLGVDVRGLIEGFHVFGSPKMERLLSQVTGRIPPISWPIAYMHPYGVIGAYLYERTGDPALGAPLDYMVRRASTAIDLKTGEVRPGTHSGKSSVAAVFEGLPDAMGVVARTGAREKPPASWLAFRDYGFPTSAIAYKKNDETLDLTMVRPQPPWNQRKGEVGREVQLVPLNQRLPWGLDLTWVKEKAGGLTYVRVPKDAPEGAYEMRYDPQRGSGNQLEFFVMTHGRHPLVLHAPGYWQLPGLRPGARVYFNIPKGTENPQIFFEGPARLFDPNGRTFGDPEGLHGWIDLPAERPGLWRFEPLQNRLVRAHNFPPFFAMHDPTFYFEPKISWERESPVSTVRPSIPDDTAFVEGAGGGEDRAFYLGGTKTLRLDDGPVGTDEGRLLPHREGTIEYFFRPAWGTFDLGIGEIQRNLLRVDTDKSRWEFMYRVDPNGTTILGGPRGPSHAFYGNIPVRGERERPYVVRCWLLESLVRRDEWLHLAYVWGPRVSYGPHGERLDLINLQVFVNGKGRKSVVFRVGNNGALAYGRPERIVVGPLEGVIDELRISDVQRYTEDFQPIPPSTRWRTDAATRLLFHFEGDLKGKRQGSPQPISLQVQP